MLSLLRDWQIVMVLSVVLIGAAARKGPELGRGFGSGAIEVQKSSRHLAKERGQRLPDWIYAVTLLYLLIGACMLGARLFGN